jgi:hypothetical protein
MPQSEIEAVQFSFADSAWAATGLPDEVRPPNPELTVVSVEEWGPAIVECLTEAGFDGYEASGGGYSGPGARSEAELITQYRCNLSVMVDPIETGLMTQAQKRFTYDYFAQTLVPCLRVRGVALGSVPTWEEYKENVWGWNPYFSVSDEARLRVDGDTRLQEECPADPPGSLATWMQG